MINKLSITAAKKFIKLPDTQYDKIEIYQYGFFVVFSNLIFFALSLIIGAILKVLLQSLIFYCVFSLLRQFAGGYHAATETRCEILSSFALIGSIGIIKLSSAYDFRFALLLFTLVSSVYIFVLCPLDTPEKPLTEKEFKYFRKISWVILLVITVIIVISYFFKIKTIFAPCCLSLILESLLLIAGKLKKCFASNNH